MGIIITKVPYIFGAKNKFKILEYNYSFQYVLLSTVLLYYLLYISFT